SLYTPQQKAVKGLLSGPRWDRAAFEKEIGTTRSQLGNLEKASRTLKPGEYRVYLAPAAVLEIVPMFSWLGLGEAGIRQGVSPYRLLRTGEKSFSPLFHLSEDFRNGAVPRFNPTGEIAPECLPLIQEGHLANTLISSRSAREYGLKSNGAAAGEH